MIVTVKFKNVVIGESVSDGTTTPVESFILNGFVYKISTNGEIYPDSETTGGDTYKYLTFAGTKFKYTNDSNGQLYPESSEPVTTKDSFWLMIDDDDVIWIVGANSNGGFNPRYLEP